MNIIYLLLPIALLVVGIIIWLFMWSIKSDQFDDMEGPAYKILMDDDQPPKKTKTSNEQTAEKTPPDDKT